MMIGDGNAGKRWGCGVCRIWCALHVCKLLYIPGVTHIEMAYLRENVVEMTNSWGRRESFDVF